MAEKTTRVLDNDADFGLICHVNLARGFRGGERQTELLIRELARKRISQRLIARRGEPLADRCRDMPGVEVRESSGTPLAVVHHAGGANVVHVHEGRSVHFAALRYRFTRTPYVVTRRVDKAIKNNAATRYAYRNATVIAPISTAIESQVKLLDTSLTCRVVPDASSALHNSEAGTQSIKDRYEGKILVGHVGALVHSDKGQLHIIEAAKALQHSHPQIQFVLLGQGRDEALFREEASQLDNVDFSGFVDNVGDYLAAFDIFVFPSLHEGLGSVLIDAMECSLPIIASRVGGIPDLIKDGENGLLVAPGDSDALAKALLRLIDDPVLARGLADRGEKMAREYTPERMAERYLEIYRPIIDAD